MVKHAVRVKKAAMMVNVNRAQKDIQAADDLARQLVAHLWGTRLARAAAVIETGIDETQSRYAMPPRHWRCIKINNFLKWLMWEMCSRTRREAGLSIGRPALAQGGPAAGPLP